MLRRHNKNLRTSAGVLSQLVALFLALGARAPAGADAPVCQRPAAPPRAAVYGEPQGSLAIQLPEPAVRIGESAVVEASYPTATGMGVKRIAVPSVWTLANPSIARVHYVPVPSCYLAPDIQEEIPFPCGLPPSVTLLQGLSEGKTRLTATFKMPSGKALTATTDVKISGAAPSFGFTSPRYGEKLVQGRRNVISWHCGDCRKDDRIMISARSYGDDRSSPGGMIAYGQPPEGSVAWDAKTVCHDLGGRVPADCYALSPGYYAVDATVEVDHSMMFQKWATSAPFTVDVPKDSQPKPLNEHSVSGAVVDIDYAPGAGMKLWVIVSGWGRRLVCVRPSTVVTMPKVSRRLCNGAMETQTFQEIKFGEEIIAKGVWRNYSEPDRPAEPITLPGQKPPPVLDAQEVEVVGSGLYGKVRRCADIRRLKGCVPWKQPFVTVSRQSSAGTREFSLSGESSGAYFAPLPPGHYLLTGGAAVDVEPSRWTRMDLDLSE